MPTLAQKALTFAMLAAIFGCGIAAYAIIGLTGPVSPMGSIVLWMVSFVIVGYVTPRVVTTWLGRSLNEILDE